MPDNVKPYGVVYLITNKVNGKVFAGMKKASSDRLARWTPEERRAKMSRDTSGNKNSAYGKPGTRLGAKWSPEQRAKHEATMARKRGKGGQYPQ